MHKTAKNNTTYWTDKHDEFCLENRLAPCAKLLWQWILRQKDDEPDLKEFNSWVETHRKKGYCRLTIKTAFNQLVESRVIKLVKQFTWHLVRIVTRTIDDLFPKKKLRSEKQIYDSPTSNGSESDGGLINNSQSIYSSKDKVEILESCASHGIFFDARKDIVLYEYELDDIGLALDYYYSLSDVVKRSIYNPPGWFLTCLRDRYWEKLNYDSFFLSLDLFKGKTTT